MIKFISLLVLTFMLFIIDKGSSMQNIDSFLDTVRLELNSTQKTKVIVTGNDSADLDSIISSLLFAYLSTQLNQDNKLYIPLVKVPKADLELRPELKYVMSQANLDYQKLICIDQVDLSQPGDIVLVDHNRLTRPLDNEGWRVQAVLDHHVDEHFYLDAPVRVVEMVGSCITLVLDQFPLDSWRQNPTLQKLALAPLLVDTVNLQWDLGRTTDRDIALFRRLDTTDSDLYFKSIEKVKSEVDTMANLDILRRDYKEFRVNGFTIGTSAVTWHLRGWARREHSAQPILEAVKTFADQRRLDMVVIVTAYDHDPEHMNRPEGDYRRELALVVFHPKLLAVKDLVEKNSSIQLSPIIQLNPDRLSHLEFYDQGNIKMSRKQVWPLIKDLIEKTIPVDEKNKI